MPEKPKAVNSALNTLLYANEIEAISDALNYVDSVADDRGNSLISGDRRERVVKILENLLKRSNSV